MNKAVRIGIFIVGLIVFFIGCDKNNLAFVVIGMTLIFTTAPIKSTRRNRNDKAEKEEKETSKPVAKSNTKKASSKSKPKKYETSKKKYKTKRK